MKITIETIPHREQRYETVGDWKFDAKGDLHVTVSDMGNDDYAVLVGLHEVIESWLCRKAGIHDPAVTAFDVQFERERAEGRHALDAEPGDYPDAPYRFQHQFATKIERLIADQLGVDWNSYSATVEAL